VPTRTRAPGRHRSEQWSPCVWNGWPSSSACPLSDRQANPHRHGGTYDHGLDCCAGLASIQGDLGKGSTRALNRGFPAFQIMNPTTIPDGTSDAITPTTNICIVSSSPTQNLSMMVCRLDAGFVWLTPRHGALMLVMWAGTPTCSIEGRQDFGRSERLPCRSERCNRSERQELCHNLPGYLFVIGHLP
jgi:hypothetical protein